MDLTRKSYIFFQLDFIIIFFFSFKYHELLSQATALPFLCSDSVEGHLSLWKQRPAFEKIIYRHDEIRQREETAPAQETFQ